MKTQALVALAIALAFAGTALATGGSQNTNYTTAGSVTAAGVNTGLTAIWCKEGGHNYAPIGNPEDYGNTQPTVDPNDPEGSADSALDAEGSYESWAFSGEPECAPTDVAFGTQDDSALIGGAFCIGGTINGADCGDHRGHEFQVSSNDVIGLPNLFIDIDTCLETEPDCDNNSGGGVSSQGCGLASVTLPTNIGRHWQSSIAEPTYLVWVWVDSALVDETTGGVCLGATGTLTAEF